MPTPLRVPFPAVPMPDLLGGVDSIAEESIAHSDSVPSQLALQSYYASVFRNGGGYTNGATTRGGLLGATNEAQSEDDPTRSTAGHSFDLSTVYRRLAEGTMSTSAAESGVCPQAQGARQDDDLSEGDSTDHMQQHGNTKKRKVPANVARAAGRERSLSLGGSEEETMMRFAGRAEHELDVLAAAAAPLLSLPPIPSAAAQVPRKGKISPSALAGLQHKELLRQRKRQLAAMLGALSLGDTFALDQALSTHIPFISTMSGSGTDSDVRKVRLSRRRGPRLARTARAEMTSSDKRTRASFPAAQFRFAYPSATSERLLATEEDMLALRKRFEDELARQAAKAAKAAAEAKQAALAVGKTPRPKRLGKGQPHTRTAVGGDTPAEPSDPLPLPKSRGTKKKKSAPDIHDRKNYAPRLSAPVPSNSVHSGQNALNLPGSQHPLLFLSANIPRKRKKATATPTAQIVDPAEEWICPHCEYSLFYSDGPEYKRAIRNRKKILRRRRRAQERAAGGLSAPKIPAKAASDDDDYGDEGQFTTQLPAIPKSTEWKQGTDIKGTDGQHHLQSG